jgi:hypothetical protein
VISDSHSISGMKTIDYDIHGLVGIRLIDPTESDAKAVGRQLGPMQKRLDRDPDITIQFVRELKTTGLHYIGLNSAGFTDDAFFILRSSKKPAKVRIPFERIGGRLEIVCQSGLRSVPLLIHILNLTLLKKGYIPVHASAFVYDGSGILVTGWAKGGKTEALLAFADHGAEYIGDDWIILSRDGKSIFGLPEPIRLWDWHLGYLPKIKRKMKKTDALLFFVIHLLDKMFNRIPGSRIKKAFPFKTLGEALPALKRQLNVTVPPENIFAGRLNGQKAQLEKVFFILSHDSHSVEVTPAHSDDIAKSVLHSIQYEQMPFWEMYYSFKFAFPDKTNSFLEKVKDLQYDCLSEALRHKEAYRVVHPYPVDFAVLYEAMRPYCQKRKIDEHKTRIADTVEKSLR